MQVKQSTKKEAHMIKKDIIIDYMVIKSSKSPDMQKVVQTIYDYIQNNKVYFKYEPTFVEGVLVFGVVGFKGNHKHIQKKLHRQLKKIGVILSIMHKRE